MAYLAWRSTPLIQTLVPRFCQKWCFCLILRDVEVNMDNCIRYIAVHEGRHTVKPLRDGYISPLFPPLGCTHFEETQLSHSEC